MSINGAVLDDFYEPLLLHESEIILQKWPCACSVQYGNGFPASTVYYNAPYGVVYLTTERIVYAVVPPVEDFKSLAVPLNKIKNLKETTSWMQWLWRSPVISGTIVPVDSSLPGPALAKFYFSNSIFGKSFLRNLQISTFEGHSQLIDLLPKYN